MKSRISRVLDVLLAPFTLAASLILRRIRRHGLERLPISRRIFRAVGVLPVTDHYYEPFSNPPPGARPGGIRRLPGVNLNIETQLAILDSFEYAEELSRFPSERPNEGGFYFRNGYFEGGDADYLYSIIRQFKPARLVEIGSGNSTLIARAAIERNGEVEPGYRCHHTCIEPYEHAWLKALPVDLIRAPVEEVDARIFHELVENDILFIDSSHVIRPGGDVLFEYLEVLPELRPGVLVHVHDIFTPRDYPRHWQHDRILLWNEQYLLEAFLTLNRDVDVIAALNHLAHHYPERLAAKCPGYARDVGSAQPGSFWLRRSR